MFLYILYVRILNHRFLKRAVRKLGKILFARDFISDTVDNKELISGYIQGKTFADVGALWGVHGENVFYALENGATAAVAIDVYDETEQFKAQKEKYGDSLKFVKGDINAEETLEQTGPQDVVLFAGVLYHAPDPLHMLMNLRRITKEILILNSASIPEVPGMRNVAVFYPHLKPSERSAWARGIGSQRAITTPYAPGEGYGNWFWGLTPSVIESMIQCAGFEVVERRVFNFRTVFVCKTTPEILELSSGPWTERKNREAAAFQW